MKKFPLMAKTNPASEEEWLPLRLHLRDTAEVMKKLTQKWLSDAVFDAVKFDYEQFLKTAVFLAAVHDIGKATSYFQSVITKSQIEKRKELEARGFLIRDKYSEKIPHAWAGQWILQSDTTGLKVPKDIAEVVGAHHGKPYDNARIDLLKTRPSSFFGVEPSKTKEQDEAKLWKDVWREITAQALELSGLKSTEELPRLTIEAQVLFSGLLIAADWIASNTNYFPLLPIDDNGNDADYAKRIEYGWNKLRFPEGWRSEINYMDEDVFKERFGFCPNETQAAMLKAVNETTEPGIFILEAQMGVGKTEAALGAAEVLAGRKKLGGIFFGLPTQATSNGIFHRLYEWSGKASEETKNAICLAHGAAAFQEEYQKLMLEGNAYVDNAEDGTEGKFGGLSVHSWFQGSKRALLADFVIGTVDQFLMASLRRKHFMLRHIGLAGKAVIIDECHAYDAYMNEYLTRSLEWAAAYGIPVILLSATLPSQRRKSLIERYVNAYARYYLKLKKDRKPSFPDGWDDNIGYPLLTWTDGKTVKQQIIEQKVTEKKVKISYQYSVSDMIKYLDERLKDGGCACVIVNTVKTAQQIYQACKEIIKDAELLLYHAQFLLPDRAKKESELLRRMGKNSTDKDRRRFIAIGTQVLEQSLDYDADVMATQLCPIDLLLQRIGRLHRHGQDGRNVNYKRPRLLQTPECVILREQETMYDEGSRAVYKDYLLLRTAQALKDEIILPKELPLLVRQVYNDDDSLGLSGELYEKALKENEERLNSQKEKANGYLLAKPSSYGISRILENDEISDETIAEASVRDATDTLEVLLMKSGANGAVFFMQKDAPEYALSKSDVPTSEQGRKIAEQRLRLPRAVVAYKRKEIIRELEDRNRRELAQWQNSPWIRGELVLLFDQNNETELGDYNLRYGYEKGLEYERKEQSDEG